MGATETTVSSILQEIFLPGIQDVWERREDLTGLVMKNKIPAAGGDAEKRVRVTRNGAIAHLTDGDTLPTPSNQGYKIFTMQPKWHYATMQVSGIADARTGGGAKAFISSLADEMEETLAHFRKRMNIAMWGGEEGILAKIGAKDDSADTVTVDLAGNDGAVGINHNAGVRYLGQVAGDVKLCIVDSGLSVIHAVDLTVSGIAPSTGVVSFSGNPDLSGVADGDFLMLNRPGLTAGSDTWENLALEGLQPAIDDGTVRTTYHGLSRSTYPILKSNVLKGTSNALRDLSEGLMEDLFQTVEVNSGVDVANEGMYQLRTSPGIYAEFKAQQIGFKRYVNVDKAEAGFKGKAPLSFNGIDIIRDVDAPYEQVYLIDFDNVKLLETHPIKWLDKDGHVLDRQATDAYQARLRWGAEMFVKNLHKMGKLLHINDNVYNHRGQA